MATAEKIASGGALVERPSKITDLATPMQPIGGPLAILPRTFGELVQFADLMSRCSFVPKHLRGKPGDCMAVAMQALRWDADPFMVAQKTYFVSEGSAPGYEAQLIAAVINARAPIVARPDISWSGDWPQRRCKVSAIFRGDTKAKEREVKAETITTRNSPLWKADPDQQLAYYALRAWARLYCPDIIMGIYTREELLATVDQGANDAAPTGSKLEAVIAEPEVDQETGEVLDDKPAAESEGGPSSATQEAAASGAAGGDNPPADPEDPDDYELRICGEINAAAAADPAHAATYIQLIVSRETESGALAAAPADTQQRIKAHAKMHADRLAAARPKAPGTTPPRR